MIMKSMLAGFSWLLLCLLIGTASVAHSIEEPEYQVVESACKLSPPWTLPFLRRNEIMIEVASSS